MSSSEYIVPGSIGYGLGQTPPEKARDLDAQILAFRKVAALHRPIELWQPHPDVDYSFESYDEAAEWVTSGLDDEREYDEQARLAALRAISSFRVCAECRQIESAEAAERGYEHAAWPCRTAQCWLAK